ncbi:protein FAM221B isoform X3 [Podarcis raffonei]|uniref:protein FAM221B isoform X3 n=1 Tax=Podarcis raffonei TaxID=65483 RepID=UPI0023291B79|nr:protein FAM221B isoform X3 [Podarcis raffonei]
MEEEPIEDVPMGPSEEEQEQRGQRTSSTALEVEEEIILPASTSLDDEDEETILPVSTSLEGEDGGKETSLPPSEWETSESLVPQEQSPSNDGSSSQPLESSEPSSSLASSPSSSPVSWRMQKDNQLQPLEEVEDTEETTAELSSILPQRSLEKKAKKKGAMVKKGALNYTARPVVPAEKAELISVAKAMHRENFGKNVKELFHLEKEAALKSIETGLYIGWRCPEYLWDCFRVGDESKCFCGHLLKQHQVYVGCSCLAFTSNFLCAACDRRWEEHETFFESEETRRKGGRPCGEAYLPFAEMPELRDAVLTGRSEDSSAYRALQGQAFPALPAPSGSRALPLPPSGPRRIVEKDHKKA